MDEFSDFNMDVSKINSWRTGIKIGAYIVYVLGALFATITFSQHVSDHFPTDHIFRLMAFAGAWANFLSLGLMPLAKEYWVAGRSMTIAAWIFWVLEVIMVVLNTLSAYGSPIAEWWTPLSPASPVFVIGIWGLLWYLSPESQVHQDSLNFYVEAQKDFQKKLQRAMKSKAVQEIMEEGAATAAQQYAEKTLGVVIDSSERLPRKKQPALPAGESVELAEKSNNGNPTKR